MTQKHHPIFLIAAQLTVLLLAALAFVRWQPPANVTLINHADVEINSTAHHHANTSEVILPDDWHKQGYRGQERIYSFNWLVSEIPQQRQAMLLRSINQNVVVYLNEHRLDNIADSVADANARLWFRPLLFPVSSTQLHAGINHFKIHLTESSGKGYLDAPIIGSFRQLSEFAHYDTLRRQNLLQAVVVAMIAVALLMLILWYRRQQNSIYGLYGAGVLCWALSNMNFIVIHPPLAVRYWDALLFICLGGFIYCTTLFMHRYLEIRQLLFEKIVLGVFLSGAVLLLLVPESLFVAFSDWLWHPVIMLVGIYLYVLIYVQAWKRNSLEIHVMAMTGSIMVLYGAHDTLIKLGLLQWGDGFLLPYSAAPSLVVFSVLLINRFTHTLDAVESLSRDLDLRVQKATSEIQKNLGRVQDLERQQLISSERERVARDIHDGVGGQLVALLSRIKSGHNNSARTEAGLQQAMDDLRLVIGSLDLPEGDLGTALATWRYRLEKKIENCGIQLIWHPSDVERLPKFGPSDILQVLRLLDEAATNVIRHAAASTITMEYGQANQQFFIHFTDNGKGGAQIHGDGHGLKNMQRRAADIGAQFMMESTDSGTAIKLLLPINR